MECRLCPVQCGADREKTFGRCGVKGLTVAKYYLHPFEEPPISHKNGSGTVFFGGCSLRCVFCQNYEVSRAKLGKSVTPQELIGIFRELEEMGADNINLVTPDHVSDLIAEALALYRPSIPVVYNSSGYALVSALERIDPFVDVYLPDFKFCSPALSERYTGRKDYFERASEAVAFMAKKPVSYDETGKMLSGCIVRHLVLPMCTSDSLKVLDFLKGVIPEDVPLSLMRQYTPMGEIEGFPELARPITAREYRRVVDYAEALGFETIFTQEKESAEKAFIHSWDF
ncbi:MAG TPA: radical SAM protein [Candidatus Gallimonas gallistercoris]|uniref:Radical SAM protein n=1 Tax=Candidatus Gallimonas gallistercoris TaxID=2838602 RepID=A0A9D2H336_9FIRM|nr:radical SAM protein [Candidatus Gallimonas gallistercoris]